MALNYGVTGVAFIGLFIGWLLIELPDVELGPLMAAAIGVTVVVPVVFFPFSKTLWAAVDLLLHRVDTKDSDSLARTFGVNASSARQTSGGG